MIICGVSRDYLCKPVCNYSLQPKPIYAPIHTLPSSALVNALTPTCVRIHTYATKLGTDGHKICNHHRPPPNVEVIHILPSYEGELSQRLCSDDRHYDSATGAEKCLLHIRSRAKSTYQARQSVNLGRHVLNNSPKSARLSLKFRHIPHKSLKTSSDNLNNPILLLSSHLVIRRQTHTSGKDISTNIFYSTGDISIGTTS